MQNENSDWIDRVFDSGFIEKRQTSEANDQEFQNDLYVGPHQSEIYSVEDAKMSQQHTFQKNVEKIQKDPNQHQKLSNPQRRSLPIQKKRNSMPKHDLYSKNYRSKKRQQMNKLKNENETLKKQNSYLKLQLDRVKAELNSNKFQDKRYTSIFQSKKQGSIKLLQELFSDDGTIDKEKLEKQFGEIYHKYHSYSAKQRFSLLTYHMSELANNLMEDWQKYICICVLKTPDLQQSTTTFSASDSLIPSTNITSNPNIAQKTQQEHPVERFVREINKISNFDSKKVNIFQKKAKQHYGNQCQKFQAICCSMYQKFIQLQDQCQVIEQCHQNLMKEVGPHFSLQSRVRSFLAFETNKFRDDLKILRNDWFDKFFQHNKHQSKRARQYKI